MLLAGGCYETETGPAICNQIRELPAWGGAYSNAGGRDRTRGYSKLVFKAP